MKARSSRSTATSSISSLPPPLAGRVPLLDLSGPLTVKEVEERVFHAARNEPRIEACQRTWMEEDRSYFVRWLDEPRGRPPLVLGLVHAYALPEMAARVNILAFDEEAELELCQALNRYVELLRAELAAESFS